MKKYCLGIITALAVASCSNFGKKLTKEEAKDYGETGYADIDGDDVEELLIGDSFKDGSLIHLAKGGERDRFSVTGGGIIVEEGSNSAADSFRKGFKINNGKLVEVNGWEETSMILEMKYFNTLTNAVCGGFTSQREISEEEMEMFRSVTGEGEMIFTPLSVSTQVVAGTNYRFYCRYEDTSKDAGDETRSGHCFVKIFKPLPGQGNPTLSEIEN